MKLGGDHPPDGGDERLLAAATIPTGLGGMIKSVGFIPSSRRSPGGRQCARSGHLTLSPRSAGADDQFIALHEFDLALDEGKAPGAIAVSRHAKGVGMVQVRTIADVHDTRIHAPCLPILFVGGVDPGSGAAVNVGAED